MPRLSKSLCDVMNEQITNELSAAYRYLAMSARCASKNLNGTARWLRLQWEEELGHATKLIGYVIERGNEVDLKTIPAPDFEFQSLRAVFEKVLADEQAVTASINAIVDRAVEEKDHAAQVFLQWFVTEQVEEENAAQAVLETLNIVGDQGPSLLIVDRQLGQRGAAAT